MDEKSLKTLEYDKILKRLSSLTAFTPSAEKALALRPTTDLDHARRLQAETQQALQLLCKNPALTIGGARDIRQSVGMAARDAVLTPQELLDIKSTLVAARTLARTFERHREEFPHLYAIASRLPPPLGLIDQITHALSDHGDILDSASVKLAAIRQELAVTRERLLAKLQRMVNDPQTVPFLQETLITQRDGRYVLPLRAEFKGRIKAIIHDQSASGATFFVEPLGVVDLNNQNRELQLEERDEEQRILAELSRQAGLHADDILLTVDTIAEIDLAFARGRLALDLSATEPVLHPFPSRQGKAPQKSHPDSVIRLYQARHPLLDQRTVVPIDIDLDPQTFILVLTGPNTGGKTVTLKTVGLLSLMAQSGLHIPAHSGSEISVFRKVFADIGDEQSIEQSLSTFSGHITNIIRILGKADRQSLVVLDELGAGTDPQEGSALARALLNHLVERKVTTLVTTHHPELKAYAHITPGVSNASVEFDLETLRPTYHLMVGLPGRSNALAIAQRLGMPGEIIQTALSKLNPEDLRADGLLDEIHRQRDMARQARTGAEQARQEAESLRSELSARLEKIADERQSILDKARLEAEQEINEIRGELRQVRRSLVRERQPLETVKEAEEIVAALEEKIEEPFERQPAIRFVPRRSLQLGDRVRLRSLNAQGVITSLGDEEAEVQVGVLRVHTDRNDLRLSEDMPPSATVDEEPSTYVLSATDTSPGWELDLRGKRADDALDALDHYLDSAYLTGLPFVRIIHGKGTGKLREAIRKELQRHPQIKSFETGSDQEGGDGVTIAKLKPG